MSPLTSRGNTLTQLNGVKVESMPKLRHRVYARPEGLVVEVSDGKIVQTTVLLVEESRDD